MEHRLLCPGIYLKITSVFLMLSFLACSVLTFGYFTLYIENTAANKNYHCSLLQTADKDIKVAWLIAIFGKRE